MVCSCPDRRRFCLYHFFQINRKQINSGKNGETEFFKKKFSSSMCVKFSRNLTHILTDVWVSICDVFCGLFFFKQHPHTLKIKIYQRTVYLPPGIFQFFPIMSHVRYTRVPTSWNFPIFPDHVSCKIFRSDLTTMMDMSNCFPGSSCTPSLALSPPLSGSVSSSVSLSHTQICDPPALSG